MKLDDKKPTRRFWLSLPHETLLATMETEGVWAVPDDIFRKTLEGLMRSDAKRAGKILTNLARQVEHPEPEVRGPSAKLLVEMGDLFVLSYAEVLDSAILHVEAQLEEETIPELQELLTDTFLDLRKLAAHAVPIKMGEAKIICDNKCGEEEMLPVHRPSDGPEQQYQARLYCYQCKTVTKWISLEPERRKQQERRRKEKELATAKEKRQAKAGRRRGIDRRRSRRSRARLPIRVRRVAEDPAETTVGHTIDTSRHGVQFVSNRDYEADEEVLVILPYDEAGPMMEKRALVVRSIPKDDHFNVALDYL